METTRKGRFWIAIGSPKAVRFIFAGMLVYALVIGGLMLGYANVQQCLANYTDEAAQSTTVRAEAAAQDRTLNNRTEAVNASDRARIIANQRATRQLIADVQSGNGIASARSLTDYNKISDESLDIFARNERERSLISTERIRVDNIRSQSPPPAAPSETC